MAKSKSKSRTMSLPATSGNITLNSGNTSTGSNNVAIGSLSSSFSFGSSSTGYVNYTMPKSKYRLLGREIELDGYKDNNIAMLLTHINTNGIAWYIEFKHQYTDYEVPLPEELSKELEMEIIAYKRDKHISDIISD